MINLERKGKNYMINRQIYTKHHAFNTTYKELRNKSNEFEDGFIRPKKYHHAPHKLKYFKSYIGYFHWANELYIASTVLITSLRKIYDRSEASQSVWYTNKNKLTEILADYKQLKLSLNSIYDDISEFQNCLLATDISEKQAQIEALSDQVKLLGTLETKITETTNRKLYEISASRVTAANILISVAALFVSLLSVIYCRG